MLQDIGKLTSASPRTVRDFVASIDLSQPASDQPRLAGGTTPANGQAGLHLDAPFGMMFRKGVAADSAAVPVVKPVSGADAAGLGVTEGMEQAYVVGSQIVSFNGEVSAAGRAAAVNSFALAQMRASKLQPDRSTPAAAFEWHAAYVNTLTQLGWVLQGEVMATQTVAQNGATVDKALLEIAGTLLGGAAAAALVGKVLDALGSMSKDDPFITLYRQRVIQQHTVSFGASIGFGAGQNVMVRVVECAVDVVSEQLQVLFLKWAAGKAALDGRRYDLALSESAYEGGRTLIEAKLSGHVQAFVAQIEV